MPRTLIVLATLLLFSCGTADVRLRDDQPGEAAEYAASKRSGTDDIHRSYREARGQMRRMPRYSTASDRLVAADVPNGRVQSDADDGPPFARWQPLGPGNIGGRTRVLVIDPTRPAVMYAAGVSGGIWKSDDGGGRWRPLTDQLANIAFNSMAIDPRDPLTLYAGTGEGYFREEVRGTALPIRGNGIYVTRNGGESWTLMPSTAGPDFHWVNDLVVSPHNSSRIYAATRSGVWRSMNGGTNWTRILDPAVKGGCLDLAIRTDSEGDYLFASCGTFAQATVYRNSFSERTADWNSVLSEPMMGRTTLAIAPSNQSIVYALAASNEEGNWNQGLLAVYRSSASGDAGSWEARVTNKASDYLATLLLTNGYGATELECRGGPAPNVFITMGWYCNTIAVDPTNPDRLFAGGVDIFRSEDGGRSWGAASYWWVPTERASYLHADQHAIVFHPAYDGVSNQTVYFANDGGVFRTDNALAQVAHGTQALCDSSSSLLKFESLNNSFGVTQFYHGAVSPDGQRIIGGAQDNGTLLSVINEGPENWRRSHGGDGGYVAFDPVDPGIVYAESQNGFFARSTNGGSSFRIARVGLSDDFLFVTPFALDPNDRRRLWIGGRRMWRTENFGNGWVAATATLPGQVSAIAITPGNPDRIFAGTNSGHIVRSSSATTDGGSAIWTATLPREGFVSSLAIDPSDPNTIWATYAGFGGVHVFRSANGGASWEPRDGSGDGALPDIPAHSIVVDPTRRDRLYLGTDLGVFVSLDAGATWAVENTGFANAITESLVIGPGAIGQAVYAFTHGRGAWRTELVVPGPRRRSVRQ